MIAASARADHFPARRSVVRFVLPGFEVVAMLRFFDTNLSIVHCRTLSLEPVYLSVIWLCLARKYAVIVLLLNFRSLRVCRDYENSFVVGAV